MHEGMVGKKKEMQKKKPCPQDAGMANRTINLYSSYQVKTKKSAAVTVGLLVSVANCTAATPVPLPSAS
jgi:hypothetical protein